MPVDFGSLARLRVWSVSLVAVFRNPTRKRGGRSDRPQQQFVPVPEAQSQTPEARRPKPKARRPKPDARSPALEARRADSSNAEVFNRALDFRQCGFPVYAVGLRLLARASGCCRCGGFERVLNRRYS